MITDYSIFAGTYSQTLNTRVVLKCKYGYKRAGIELQATCVLKKGSYVWDVCGHCQGAHWRTSSRLWKHINQWITVLITISLMSTMTELLSLLSLLSKKLIIQLLNSRRRQIRRGSQRKHIDHFILYHSWLLEVAVKIIKLLTDCCCSGRWFSVLTNVTVGSVCSDQEVLPTDCQCAPRKSGSGSRP